jgi:hypothetical protein
MLSVSQTTAHSDDDGVTSKLAGRDRGLIEIIRQHIPRKTEENGHLSGQFVSGPRFEPGTSQIQIKCLTSTHHAARQNDVRIIITGVSCCVLTAPMCTGNLIPSLVIYKTALIPPTLNCTYSKYYSFLCSGLLQLALALTASQIFSCGRYGCAGKMRTWRDVAAREQWRAVTQLAWVGYRVLGDTTG